MAYTWDDWTEAILQLDSLEQYRPLMAFYDEDQGEETNKRIDAQAAKCEKIYAALTEEEVR